MEKMDSYKIFYYVGTTAHNGSKEWKNYGSVLKEAKRLLINSLVSHLHIVGYTKGKEVFRNELK